MTTVGTPPYPRPWPSGDHYDPELLRNGDTRNVQDKYRYWNVEAIKSDLDAARIPLEIAIENVTRDFNMGTIVRSANAFNVSKIHIIGRRQWNKRGAMVTDSYMNIVYHDSVESFLETMRTRQKTIIAVDIVEGALPLAKAQLPQSGVLVFGSEGEGLSEALLTEADSVVHIEQFGSTRSINVGVAAGIVMYEWVRINILTHHM